MHWIHNGDIALQILRITCLVERLQRLLWRFCVSLWFSFFIGSCKVWNFFNLRTRRNKRIAIFIQNTFLQLLNVFSCLLVKRIDRKIPSMTVFMICIQCSFLLIKFLFFLKITPAQIFYWHGAFCIFYDLLARLLNNRQLFL